MDTKEITRTRLEERLDGTPILFPFEGGIVELEFPQDYSLPTQSYAIAGK